METIIKVVSKKLAIAIFTMAIVALNNRLGLGLDDATVNHLVTVAVAYLFGQTIIDAAKAVKAPKATSLPAPCPPAETPQGDGTISSPVNGGGPA